MPESVLSRLARSTELSKTESRSAGAVRIQSRRTRYKSESDCPRNLSTIRAAQNPVNASPSQNFHVISTTGKTCRGGLGSKRLVPAHDGMAFRFEALISAQAEAEDRKLRKELTFGGPCLEGTLQKPLLFPNQAPWPGRLENA